VALNVAVDAAAAEAMSSHFLEVIVAPSFDDGAREILTRKKNLRLIELPVAGRPGGELDYKRVRGGLLAQHRHVHAVPGGRLAGGDRAGAGRGNGRTCGSPGGRRPW
jgi:AICAR transformylase/IMP cyclohydrolase PurH